MPPTSLSPLAPQGAAPPPRVFRSFWQGGFECSTHVLRSGRRLDLVAATGHDCAAEADYRQLSGLGIRTVRDGLRWHLIESAPGRYDFSSFVPMLRAARRAGTQVIWDLHHYGTPDGLDVFSPGFAERFARFAAAAAQVVRSESDEVPWWCPVNEISFLSWAGGDVGYLNPFATGRGFELKVQLARAAIAAMAELRAVDPRARFLHCEPMIAIHPAIDGTRGDEAQDHNESQFQALDLVSGRIWPQIGGAPDLIDVVGANYYIQNQWRVDNSRLYPGDEGYRPVSALLAGMHARYGRPVVVSETGIEADRRAGWLRYMAEEVLRARAMGVPVEGLCLYPVVNHIGWDDDRICPSGLLGHEPGATGRTVYPPLAEELARLRLGHPTLDAVSQRSVAAA